MQNIYNFFYLLRGHVKHVEKVGPIIGHEFWDAKSTGCNKGILPVTTEYCDPTFFSAQGVNFSVLKHKDEWRVTIRNNLLLFLLFLVSIWNKIYKKN